MNYSKAKIFFNNGAKDVFVTAKDIVIDGNLIHFTEIANEKRQSIPVSALQRMEEIL